jgi:phage tail tape-measure protein
MDQVNSEITSGTIGAATTGASTGAAIGSVIPGVGTAVGAVAGGVIGGIAGLFGGSSRRKEEEKRIRHAMLLSKALNDDARMNAFTEKARKLENQKYGD